MSKMMALGGVLAALAVVIMSLGGMIPVATFICPMLCMMLLQFVLKACGNRIAWAWYGAVAILSLLLGPDKEAAAVFLFLGYYPIVKPKLDVCRAGILWKGIFFNTAILIMYWLLINLFGIAQVAQEFREAGIIMTLITLILGNMTFFMLDMVLGKLIRRKRHE